MARLQARSMFKDIRAEAEEYIYKKLVTFLVIRVESHTEHVQISQMDQFLELASYDWMLSEPQGKDVVPRRTGDCRFCSGLASQWLMDLIAFLKSIFESFTNLPSRLAGMACMSSCQHLARSIINLLLDENIKAISNGALQQMDLDLVQCEMFASSEPVPGMEEGVLVMCFLDLR